jgi:cell volume regulation protein A
MTTAIIITLCSLLLIAYVFDLTSSKTKIPSVILLLLLGWIVRQLSIFFAINLPDLTPLLPILGTVGLILIVLEGSLELELNRSKKNVIVKSFVVALLPMIALSFSLAALFHYTGHFSFKNCLANAIPLSVISSAVAIPSVRNLNPFNKEFIIYESSLSDIIGVLFFNFITMNDSIGVHSFGNFTLELLIMIVISFIATIGLAFLLSKIDHHIKFAPIILLIILIYAIAKEYHLPSLIFILLLGLFLGNLDEIKNIKWIKKFKPDELNKEIIKFKELTIEITFLIRTLFFLLFGYLIETAQILNLDTLVWAIATIVLIFSIRAVQLKLLKLPLKPLLFIAPRGLITILLFFSIPAVQNISLVNKSYVIQVIILTALVMMIGFIMNKEPAVETSTTSEEINCDAALLD